MRFARCMELRQGREWHCAKRVLNIVYLRIDVIHHFVVIPYGTSCQFHTATSCGLNHFTLSKAQRFIHHSLLTFFAKYAILISARAKITSRGRTKMKPIIPPVEFFSPLSEIEVKMTLQQLCGSKWDNSPFSGTVNENSFKLIKNRLTNRGITYPILLGDFVAQDNKTKVTVSMRTRTMDTIGSFIFALCGLALAIFVFIATLSQGIASSIVSFLLISGFTAGVIYLDFYISKIKFQKHVNDIKSALKSVE